MEDYTYHLEPGNELVLGAHMLEICPSIAATQPAYRGPSAGHRRQGRPGPPGLRRRVRPGHQRLDRRHGQPLPPDHQRRSMPSTSEHADAAICRSRACSGSRSRRCAPPPQSWILAGGAHHTGFSLAITAEQMIDWAELVGIESLLIDKDTDPLAFRNELRWSDAAWRLSLRVIMKAMKLTGLRRMAVQEVPAPALSRPTDVLVRMARWASAAPTCTISPRAASAASASSIPGASATRAPALVEEVGPAVTRVKPGDRIAFDPALPVRAVRPVPGGPAPHLPRPEISRLSAADRGLPRRVFGDAGAELLPHPGHHDV